MMAAVVLALAAGMFLQWQHGLGPASTVPELNESGSAVEEPRYVEMRGKMVEQQLLTRDITDSDVIRAMSEVPRQEFMPEDVRDRAYLDSPQPIGYGQTISQPYIVALMTEELELDADDRVLEVGTGSGYQAAVLAEIVDEVYSMEIVPELADRSNRTLHRLGYRNAHVKNSDGYFGWPDHSPYDAVIITAAVDHIPHPLIQQLADGGRLILPLGSVRYYQTLTVVDKEGGETTTKYVTDVRFVPMTGEALNR